MPKSFAILLLILWGSPALSASPVADIFCDEREALLHKLKVSHGAERQGRGMRGPDAIIEVWMVPSTGEWTMVQSYANGLSCVIAMGENWEALQIVSDPA